MVSTLVSLLVDAPEHRAPHELGAGLLHDRLIVRVCVPQLSVHAGLFHALHPPFLASNPHFGEKGGGEREKQKSGGSAMHLIARILDLATNGPQGAREGKGGEGGIRPCSRGRGEGESVQFPNFPPSSLSLSSSPLSPSSHTRHLCAQMIDAAHTQSNFESAS